MLYLDRLCIPLGLACDLDCSYCYRQAGKTSVPRLTQKMIDYIQSLTPDKTYCVIASGGEPLLYWKRVKELFSYVPEGIYKKVMTNGTHLTQEIVDYCNDNKVEVHFSHDGWITKQTRGVDVLDDPKILDLIKQIKIMRVHTTVVSGNEDIIADYNYIVDKLGRTDFRYTAQTVFGDINRPELTENFNYELYTRTWIEMKLNIQKEWDRYRKNKPGGKSLGLNVLPDGTVISMVDMQRLGTIDDDRETIVARSATSKGQAVCDRHDCPIRDKGLCGNATALATDHLCKVQIQGLSAISFVKHTERIFDAKCI